MINSSEEKEVIESGEDEEHPKKQDDTSDAQRSVMDVQTDADVREDDGVSELNKVIKEEMILDNRKGGNSNLCLSEGDQKCDEGSSTSRHDQQTKTIIIKIIEEEVRNTPNGSEKRIVTTCKEIKASQKGTKGLVEHDEKNVTNPETKRQRFKKAALKEARAMDLGETFAEKKASKRKRKQITHHDTAKTITTEMG